MQAADQHCWASLQETRRSASMPKALHNSMLGCNAVVIPRMGFGFGGHQVAVRQAHDGPGALEWDAAIRTVTRMIIRKRR